MTRPLQRLLLVALLLLGAASARAEVTPQDPVEQAAGLDLVDAAVLADDLRGTVPPVLVSVVTGMADPSTTAAGIGTEGAVVIVVNEARAWGGWVSPSLSGIDLPGALDAESTDPSTLGTDDLTAALSSVAQRVATQAARARGGADDATLDALEDSRRSPSPYWWFGLALGVPVVLLVRKRFRRARP
jgi:hypothetical protein